jgi:hypothetical protein
MGDFKIRKQVLVIEDTLREVGEEVKSPMRKVAAIVVIENPYAGKYEKDLSTLIGFSVELGKILAERAVKALDVAQGQIKCYGKGAIVGSMGELEHCAAILHGKLGKSVRDVIGGGRAIIPSTQKRGGPGTHIDVPLHYKDDEWQYSYFDAMEVSVSDAPGPDEIVITLVLTNAGRPLARMASNIR